MGRIQSSIGLVTGTDITGTVDQLIKLSAAPRDRLLSRVNDFQRQQTALAELTASVIGVQLSGNQLGKESLFQSRKATSSLPDAMSISAGANATVGSYSVRTLQTAATHTAQSQRGFATATTPLGLSGELNISGGGFLEQTTSLSDLNQGRGVQPGAIRITDRSGKIAEIDLSAARTIDDVLDAINSQTDVSVRATADAERIMLEDLTGSTASNLRVDEVGRGETAADLGLFGIDVAADQVSGADLTPPDASATRLIGLDRLDVRFAEGADLKVQLADGSMLELDLNSGDAAAPTTIGELIDAINAAAPSQLSASLSAGADRILLQDLTSGSEALAVSDAGTATVASSFRLDQVSSGGEVSSRSLIQPLRGTRLEDLGGGSGLGTLTTLDITLRDGTSASVDVSTAATIQEVADAINASGLVLNAKLDDSGTGLRIRDLSGGTSHSFQISSIDETAANLGVEFDADDTIVDGRSLNRQFVSRSTLLSNLNQGRGIGSGSFTITDSAGVSGAVNLKVAKAETVGDLINAINELPIGVEARLNERGDGIQIVDVAGGSETMSIVDVGSAGSAKALGIVGEATEQSVAGQTVMAIVGGERDTFAFTAEDSLESIVERINATSRLATASIVTDDTGRSRLQLQSRRGGAAGRLDIDSTTPAFALATTARGQDAEITLSGDDGRQRYLQSSDGVFDDATTGLTLTLKQLSDQPIKLTVNENPEAVTKGVQTFVDQFNKLVDKLDSLTFYNEASQEVGLLFGSSEALRIDLTYGRLLSGEVRGAGSIRSFSQVGIRLNDQGKLELDSEKLLASIEQDSDAVVNFFTTEETGVAAQLNQVAERIAGAGNSLLINRTETLGQQIERGNQRIESLNIRLESQRERLLKQYYAMEQAIAKIQSNQSYISHIQPINLDGSRG